LHTKRDIFFLSFHSIYTNTVSYYPIPNAKRRQALHHHTTKNHTNETKSMNKRR